MVGWCYERIQRFDFARGYTGQNQVDKVCALSSLALYFKRFNQKSLDYFGKRKEDKFVCLYL